MGAPSIVIREQDGAWQVVVDGEVMTIHSSREEAVRSADILAVRLAPPRRDACREA